VARKASAGVGAWHDARHSIKGGVVIGEPLPIDKVFQIFSCLSKQARGALRPVANQIGGGKAGDAGNRRPSASATVVDPVEARNE